MLCNNTMKQQEDQRHGVCPSSLPPKRPERSTDPMILLDELESCINFPMIEVSRQPSRNVFCTASDSCIDDISSSSDSTLKREPCTSFQVVEGYISDSDDDDKGLKSRRRRRKPRMLQRQRSSSLSSTGGDSSSQYFSCDEIFPDSDAPPSSNKQSEDEALPPRRKSVTFSDVHVREYARCVDPFRNERFSLTLGWDHNDQPARDVELFEASRFFQRTPFVPCGGPSFRKLSWRERRDKLDKFHS